MVLTHYIEQLAYAGILLWFMVIYVTIYMFCGALFYSQLASLLHRQQLLQHVVFVLCMMLVLLIIIYLVKKR